jgi:hypothetical protein
MLPDLEALPESARRLMADRPVAFAKGFLRGAVRHGSTEEEAIAAAHALVPRYRLPRGVVEEAVAQLREEGEFAGGGNGTGDGSG